MKPTFDFDQELDRSGTGAVKWEYVQDPEDPLKKIRTDAYFGDDPVIPLWVADMDFPCPEPVVRALVERSRHAVFGYTGMDDRYRAAVTGWMENRQGWRADPDWIVPTPGVVPALHMAVRAFAEPGQNVLVQQPVYYPFFSAVEKNGCRVVSNSLVLENGQYRMDLEDLETKAADPSTRLMILCSPHNPVGRVWDLEELEAVADICSRHGILIISDEIHGDLVYPGERFHPLAVLGEAVLDNAIICTAPSKTFNLAGLNTSNIIISNPELKSAFKKALGYTGLGGMNPFGMEACIAAYNEGLPWLEAILSYLAENLDAFTRAIEEGLEGVRVIRPQGTYLVWVDFRSLNLLPMELGRILLEEARVFLDHGYIFGPEGSGFERINIACPRRMLLDAAGRIVDTLSGSSRP